MTKNLNFILKGDEKIASSVITVRYHLRSERGKNERKITSQKIKGRCIFMHFFPNACFIISTLTALLRSSAHRGAGNNRAGGYKKYFS